MARRYFMAALLGISAMLLTPWIGLADKYSSTPSRPAYTPPPPRVYTPPARTTTPSNSNTRPAGTTPQSSNGNTVRPTPRVTVTPRATAPAGVTRTPSNSNNQARQVANSNLKQQQQRQLQQKQVFAQKQQQLKQQQQKQLFVEKQQQQKLSAQKEADSKARLAKLRVINLGQKGTLSPTFKDAAAGTTTTGTGEQHPPATLTDKFNKAATAPATKPQKPPEKSNPALIPHQGPKPN